MGWGCFSLSAKSHCALYDRSGGLYGCVGNREIDYLCDNDCILYFTLLCVVAALSGGREKKSDSYSLCTCTGPGDSLPVSAK